MWDDAYFTNATVDELHELVLRATQELIRKRSSFISFAPQGAKDNSWARPLSFAPCGAKDHMGALFPNGLPSVSAERAPEVSFAPCGAKDKDKPFYPLSMSRAVDKSLAPSGASDTSDTVLHINPVCLSNTRETTKDGDYMHTVLRRHLFNITRDEGDVYYDFRAYVNIRDRYALIYYDTPERAAAAMIRLRAEYQSVEYAPLKMLKK